MSHLLKTFFDPPLLVLWGDKASDDGKRTRMSFGFRDGRPRFTVSTGVQGRDGMIIFPADVPTITTLMLYLSDVATGPADNKIVNESLAPVYVDNVATSEKKVKGALIIGKTKDGIVYITVIAEGYPKIIFPFKSSDFHIWRDNNKEVIPAAEISVKMAQAYSEQVRSIITTAIYQHACEEYDSGNRKLASTDRQDGPSGNKSATNNNGKNNRFEDLDDLAL